MSQKERSRLVVISRVREKAMTIRDASEVMGISYRQGRRIYKGEFAVVPGHFQGRVSQHLLQAEGATAVSEKAHRCRVAQRVRGASHSLETRPGAVLLYHGLDAVLGEWPAIHGEKNQVKAYQGRLGTQPADIAPQQPLQASAHGDQPLLIPLAQHPQGPFVKPRVTHPEACQFTDPNSRVKQGEDDGIVAEARRGTGIDSVKECPDLRVGEGRHQLHRGFGHLHHVKGALVDDSLP